MLTIQQVLQKLQLLQLNTNPSEIDVDLMLDYTRHLYDLILDQKQSFAGHNFAAINTTAPEFEKEVIEVKPVGNMLQHIVNNITVQPNTEADTNAFNDEMDNIFSVNYLLNENEDLGKNTEQFKTESKDINSEIALRQPKENDGINLEMPSSISFDAPPPVKETPSKIQVIIEEQSINIAPPIQEAIISKPKVQKDFRTSIGFNDRYLFLNALFQNNPAIMDETIVRINAFDSAEAAKTWLTEECAEAYNWEEDNTNVQAFYALLDKHFRTI